MIGWRNVEAPALREVFAHLDEQPSLREVRAALHARVAAAPPLVAIDGEAVRQALDSVAHSALERGGLLVGTACRWGGHGAGGEASAIALVHVRCAVPADETSASAIALRMDAAVWDAARARLRGGDERVVGWYHSHPGIGAFFSDTDRRTQGAFFREAYSLGWVIDPVRGEQAWFVGAASSALAARDVMVLGASAC